MNMLDIFNLFDEIKNLKTNDIKWIFIVLDAQSLQKNENITIKHKIDGKIIFFRCIACGFEKPETIDKVELSGLLKG